MSRVYGEPVDVRMREGRPVRFVWRGQVYVVRRVLEHWVTGERKKAGAPQEGAGERRFWRIEASSNNETRIYELRLDTATGRWLLLRGWS